MRCLQALDTKIGIVHYPGAQVACILGLTDFSASLPRLRSINGDLAKARFALRIGNRSIAATRNLSCVYDSAPRGNPKPLTLIIPPTMVDLPDPDVPPAWCPGSVIGMPPVPRWFSRARVRLSLPKRVSWTGSRLPHTRFAQRRWRSVFRKSSSTQSAASLIMATSSRQADSCHGSILACFWLTGFLARP